MIKWKGRDSFSRAKLVVGSRSSTGPVKQRVSRFSRKKRLSYRTLETERRPTPPGNQGGTGLGRVRGGGWIALVQGYRFYDRSRRIFDREKGEIGILGKIRSKNKKGDGFNIELTRNSIHFASVLFASVSNCTIEITGHLIFPIKRINRLTIFLT